MGFITVKVEVFDLTAINCNQGNPYLDEKVVSFSTNEAGNAMKCLFADMDVKHNSF